MLDLSTLSLILLIAFVAAIFWQFRMQEERATAQAARYCKQHRLQLLDVSRKSGKLVWSTQGPAWQAEFMFGFSSDKEHRYEGRLQMTNLRLTGIDTPVYRDPFADSPPSSQP